VLNISPPDHKQGLKWKHVTQIDWEEQPDNGSSSVDAVQPTTAPCTRIISMVADLNAGK
jgi:hypothetical protein